jgi:hypothetical protein
VAELRFSPEADERLTALEADPLEERCAARLNSALDRLEADPGDVVNRRRRFNTLGLWGITVTCGDTEWLILWEPVDDDAVIVHHIVPAP